MLPALAVTTPRAVSPAGACRIALAAPRILNDPIGCRHSSLSQISAAASGASSRTSGVWIAAPRIVSRARSMSASGIIVVRSELDLDAHALLAGAGHDE